MARRRVETDELLELVRLHRMGTSARETARLLRIGPNTELRYRRAIESVGLLQGSAQELPGVELLRRAVATALPPRSLPRPSSLEAWRPQVEALMARGLGPIAVCDRLRLSSEGTPFQGSYSAVKRLCRQVRREVATSDLVAIPVESLPGECAQVDFGYVGKLYDPRTGVLRRAWAFVFLLAFSRLMWVRIVLDQRIETWLSLHVQALTELGGVVTSIRPDNNRRAILRAAFGADGQCELNRSYRELARHFGFVVDPGPQADPRKRGKVEAAVRFLRSNPLKGRDGESVDRVEADLIRWNREIASLRRHRTTGRRPRDAFEEAEHAALRPLPTTTYQPAVWKKARVHPDSHVAFRDRLYSVPWQLVSEEVWLRATDESVEVFHEDRRVAQHARQGGWRSTHEEHLPADRRELRHRGRAFWEERARRIGVETVALVQAAFESDPALSNLRRVQAIVKHLAQFPRPRAEAASRHALATGDLTYRAVKDFLTSGRDLASS